MEYIKHLWNGNRSLPFTYWVIYVIGNGLVTVLDRGLDASGFYGSTSLLFILVFVALSLIYFGFSVVCVWRSSNKFEGAAIWAILAKVFVGLGILRTIVAFFSNM